MTHIYVPVSKRAQKENIEQSFYDSYEEGIQCINHTSESLMESFGIFHHDTAILLHKFHFMKMNESFNENYVIMLSWKKEC